VIGLTSIMKNTKSVDETMTKLGHSTLSQDLCMYVKHGDDGFSERNVT
jgi:hypothetical protein